MWTLTRFRLFCAASAAAIAVVGPASAQSTVSGDKVEAVEAQINAPVSRNKLEALEAQINALQQELRDLKGKVNKTEQTAQKAYAANPTAAQGCAASTNRAHCRSQNDAFEPTIGLRH